MKRLFKASALAAVAAATALSASAAGRSTLPPPGTESYGYTPIALGIATPVQIPWGFTWDVYALDASFFYADANEVTGLEISLGGCVSRTYMAGAQISGLCNYSDGDVYGLQTAIACVTDDVYGLQTSAFAMGKSMYGLQAGLLGTVSEGDLYGVRAAGLANVSMGESLSCGVELAGLANVSRKVEGFQGAIGCNYAENLHGFQLAIVNYAQSSSTSAVQIGLVNIIRDNVVPVLPIVNGCFFDGTEGEY